MFDTYSSEYEYKFGGNVIESVEITRKSMKWCKKISKFFVKIDQIVERKVEQVFLLRGHKFEIMDLV